MDINAEYPIPQGLRIKATYKPLFGPGQEKAESVYQFLPKSELYQFSDDSLEVAIVHMAGFLSPFFGWRAIRIQEEFPDGLYEDIGSGELIRVEFERMSTDFLRHEHDPAGCDVIVCWKDDLAADARTQLLNANPRLKVVELSTVFHHYDFDIEREGSGADAGD